MSGGLIYLSVAGGKVMKDATHMIFEFVTSKRQTQMVLRQFYVTRLCGLDAAFRGRLMAVLRRMSDWINISEVCQIFVSSDQNTWNTCRGLKTCTFQALG